MAGFTPEGASGGCAGIGSPPGSALYFGLAGGRWSGYPIPGHNSYTRRGNCRGEPGLTFCTTFFIVIVIVIVTVLVIITIVIIGIIVIIVIIVINIKGCQ